MLRKMKTGSVHCVVSSPPYWNLRDYGDADQLGLELTPQSYIKRLVKIFREVRRVLRSDGVCWINIGDTYMGGMTGGVGKNTITSSRNHNAVRAARIAIAGNGGPRHRKAPGLKEKDLCLIPQRLAIALQEDGWWIRSDCIWNKPSPLPESAKDRPSRCHEYLFMITKSPHYFYDGNAIRRPLATKTLTTFGTKRTSKGTDSLFKVASHNFSERMPERKPTLDENGELAGANARTVWTVAQEPYKGAHFATFPRRLVEPCILSGSPAQGIVLDPFAGSGTTLEVALELGRQAVGIEISAEYCKLIEARLKGVQYPLHDVR